MAGSLEAGLLFLILLGSSVLGLFVRPLLSEAHRSRETTDFVQLVVTMLVTFVAVVLGLLTSSAKASFDRVGNELKGLSVGRIQLDRSLREWGVESDPARELLRDTRPRSSPALAARRGNHRSISGPLTISGSLGSPALGDMLSRVELDIRRLE